jgi:energy-converting hydrogenase Eha subunit C
MNTCPIMLYTTTLVITLMCLALMLLRSGICLIRSSQNTLLHSRPIDNSTVAIVQGRGNVMLICDIKEYIIRKMC